MSTSAWSTTRGRAARIGRTFTVEYLGNVVGGQRVKYLNVEMGLMKEIAQRTLEERRAGLVRLRCRQA